MNEHRCRRCNAPVPDGEVCQPCQKEDSERYACWLSGQITPAQMQQHLREEPDFARWVMRKTA